MSSGVVEFDDRPTVLLVGGGERMHAALSEALERHHLMVEAVSTEKIVEAAFAAAPDLLVLLGDAAMDGGEAALGKLSEHAAASMVPVVLLTNQPGLDSRLEAFRHGVVAVVPRTASADGMARGIAEVAKDLPERTGEWGGELGEATVDELVALFSEQLRTGILSVTSGGASAQVVLRSGRPVAEAMQEFVDRLRPLIDAQPGPVHYEFHEAPDSRLNLLTGGEPASIEPADILSGRRLVLIEQNPARADMLTQELRARGAVVAVANGEGSGLERARNLDPDVAILDGSGVDNWANGALRMLRRDPRLRWASLLIVDAKELWPEGASAPNLRRLTGALAPLVKPDQDLAERAASQAAFDLRLEHLGPGRTLRALTSTGIGLKLTVTHPRIRVEVDLAEGLVVGARAFRPRGNEQVAEGPAALAALIAIGSGRARVEKRDAPSSTNVMAPVDDSLAAASQEQPPIRPSHPPPSVDPPPRIRKPNFEDRPTTRRALAQELATSTSSEQLVGKLEQLVEKLETVLPAAQAAAASLAPPAATSPPASPPQADVATRAEPPPDPVVVSPQKPVTVPLPKHRLAPPKVPREALPRVPEPRRRDQTLVGATGPAARPPWEPVAMDAEVGDEPLDEIAGEATAITTVVSPTPPTPPPQPPPAAPPPSPPHAAADPLPPSPARTPPPHAAADPMPAATPPPEPALAPAGPPSPASFGAKPDTPPAPASASVFPAAGRPVETATPFGELASPDDASLKIPTSKAPLLIGVGAVIAVLFLLSFGAVGWWATRDAPEAVAADPTASTPTAGGAPRSASANDPALGDEPRQDAGISIADHPVVSDGPPDAGPPDAGPPDAGPPDAGTPDPGPEEIVEDAPDGEPDGEGESPERASEIGHLIRTANFQRQNNQLREAERNYIRVLQISPRNARALAGLTRVAMARRDGTQAVRWARHLTEIRGSNPNNQVLLGDAYQVAGNRAAALRSWRRALELHPGHTGALRRLGNR